MLCHRRAAGRSCNARMAVSLRTGLPFRVRVWQIFLSVVAGVAAVTPAAGQGGAESPGVVVRKIVMERAPIFEQKDLDRIPWLPLSWANKLHVDTREDVILNELLFEEGGYLDPEHLQESERKLRGLGIFADVVVAAVPAAGDSVDIMVRTKEVWTTAVDVGYESFEDERLVSLSVSERNLLGSARRVDMDFDSGIDRSSWSVGLRDPQLFDGTWQTAVSFRDADDGNSWGASIGRPYQSLTDERSWSLNVSSREFSPRFYIDDSEWVRPDGRFNNVSVGAGWKIGATPRYVWNTSVGFLLESQDLDSEQSLEVETPSGTLEERVTFPDEPKENHSWRTVYVGISQRTRRYDELRFVRGMGKVEDVPIGVNTALSLGWTTRALGSTTSGLFVSGNVNWSVRGGESWLHTLNASMQGLINEGGGRDLRFVTSVRGLHTVRNGVIFATGMRFGAISQADRHQVLSLGLESGLRAARFREFNGDRLLRANVELRFVYTPGVWDIIVPGITLFGDTGASWFEDGRDFRPEILRGAYGIGFRMGFLRSADELPFRLDLAWPALYDTDRSAPVVSIGMGQVF